MSSKRQTVQKYREGIQKEKRREKLQSARKGAPRRKPKKPPRQKDWSRLAGDWDALDYVGRERIVPPAETERRRMVEQIARSLPSAPEDTQTENPADGQTGTVVEISSGGCRVALEGLTLDCSLRGALTAEESGYANAVAVGDRVVVSPNGGSSGVVEAVLARKSALTRPETGRGHRQQVLVANVDQVLIVSSWRQPDFWPELVDRYLIAAALNDLRAVLCVNKIDLVTDEADFERILRPYHNLDLEVLPTSAVTGAGVENLRQHLQACTTVLAGLSGVGKSSLLNTVQPGLGLRTKEVGERGNNMNQGRHTTTQAVYLPLEEGGAVVDTPGIREFGLAGVTRSQLAAYFPELAAQQRQCQYRDCSHLEEPDCAVRMAVEKGEISESRFDSYLKIYDTLAE